MKHLNAVPSPEYIRENFKHVDKLVFNFADGVSLQIFEVTPDKLADFYMYQGVDVNLRSDDALPDTYNWFKMRGCTMKVYVNKHVKKYSRLWFLDKFKIFVFKFMFL